MAPVQSSASAALRDEKNWKKELENIELDDLKPVSKFSSGTFSHVLLVQIDGHPNISFALKSMKKAEIKHPFYRQLVFFEKTNMNQARSSFIVKLYRTFKTKKHLYFLMEYLPGGDLNNLDVMSEDNAKFYMACVVEALDCLHAQNIVHNDVSPDNLVLDADGYVKLIDFGMSQKLEPGEVTRGFYNGVAQYLPPEVAWPLLNNNCTDGGDVVDHPLDDEGRDKGVDLWALGILLCDLVTGTTPFEASCEADSDEESQQVSDETIYRNVIDGMKLIELSSGFTKEAEDLVRKLCAHDPASRLGYGSIDEIREHRWFNGFDWDKLRERKLTPPMVPEVEDVVDTQNFAGQAPDSDQDVEEDDSDWDKDF